MRLPIAILTLVVACPLARAGEQDRTLTATRLAAPPTIDGVVNVAAEWAAAPTGTDFVDHDTGQPGGVKTRFWLASDAKFVYFAAIMEDPRPRSVKATEYRTNVSLQGDDTVSLMLDPFGNMMDFNGFTMNANGGTNIEIAGGRAAKREWLGEIVSKGRITSEGWEVEARIPWAIMKLPNAGQRNLRFNVERYYSATQRKFKWRYNGGRAEDMPVWAGVEVPRVDQRRSLKLLPFGYLGAEEGGHGIFDGGLDLKTSLTDQIELVGSAKPDFRNIENQILSLDFSYFTRLAEDGRPFFQEGMDYFELGGDQRLFVSQQIDNFDAALKSYGKLTEKTSFGVLNMASFGNWNALVGSASHNPDLNTEIHVGGTSYAKDGEQNDTGMVTVSRRFGGISWYGNNQWTDDQVKGKGRRTNTGLFYEAAGWEAYGEYVEVSPDFHPAIGYSPEQDLKGFNGNLGYTKPTSKMGLAEAGFEIGGLNYQNFDGTHYRSLVRVQTSTTWKDGTDLDLSARFVRFGGRDDRLYTLDLEKPRMDPYRHWGISASWGRIEERDYRSGTVGISYRPLSHLQLALRYQAVQHDGFSDQMIATANWDLGRDRGLSGRLVKRGEDWNGYVAFRQSGNRGNEYFLILGDPNSRTFRASVILKVTIPIEIRL